MSYDQFRLAEARRELRDEEALRLARSHLLLRRASLVQQGWLSRQACRLLVQVGRLLVAAGGRLQRYARLPPPPFEEAASSGQ
jgi:hypothetical protein